MPRGPYPLVSLFLQGHGSVRTLGLPPLWEITSGETEGTWWDIIKGKGPDLSSLTPTGEKPRRQRGWKTLHETDGSGSVSGPPPSTGRRGKSFRSHSLLLNQRSQRHWMCLPWANLSTKYVLLSRSSVGLLVGLIGESDCLLV